MRVTTARFAPWAAYAALLAAAPWCFDSPLALTMLTQMGIAIVACLSFNLLLGQGGMLSFGHAVYTGAGAYAAIHALNAAAGGVLAVPVSALPLVGGTAGALCALLLGWLNTRHAGTSFAMISLGLAELVAAIAPLAPGLFGGEAGISADRVSGAPRFGLSFGPAIEVYGLIAVYAFACTFALYALTRTPFGRLLNAVRDNAERLGHLGGDARRVRYLAFVIAGFFAGVAGGLAALNFEIVTPEVLGAPRSGAYLLFTVLGGTAVFAGPIIGALLMVLAGVALSAWTPAWLLYVGVGFIVMVMWAPGGIAGLLMLARDLGARGRLAERSAAGLALLGAGAAALGGAAALVEILYRQRLGDAPDAASIDNWVGAGFVALTGAVLAALVWRELRREGER